MRKVTYRLVESRDIEGHAVITCGCGVPIHVGAEGVWSAEPGYQNFGPMCSSRCVREAVARDRWDDANAAADHESTPDDGAERHIYT